MFEQVTEVFGFSQDDLFSDEVMILDCYSDIFVWVGQNVSANLRGKVTELGQVIFLMLIYKYALLSLNSRPIF